MDDHEAYTFVLRNLLNEVEMICPEISNAFIFKHDKTLMAKDRNTDETAIEQTAVSFLEANRLHEITGEIETIKVQGTKGQTTVLNLNGSGPYLALTTSNKADEKVVKALSQIVISTAVKLVDKLDNIANEQPIEASLNSTQKLTEQDALDAENVADAEEAEEEFIEQASPENLKPVIQARIESINGVGGFLRKGDTARIDGDVLAEWKKIFKNKLTNQVELCFDNYKLTVEIKPAKVRCATSDLPVIQLPERVISALRTSKGAVVTVKPVTNM